jgi:hypothetical protein
MNELYVSASELADYIYCQCCWIDRLEGRQEKTLAMEKGTQEHSTIQRQSFLFTVAQRATIALILISIILFLTQVILVFIYHTTLW